MRITKVELQNWGPFWGQVEFEMGSKEINNQPLTVIHAKNGHGKTSILRALKWVIVGGRDGKIKIGPNINWKAFNGDKKFETSVTLHFRQGNVEYKLRRYLEIPPTGKGKMSPRELKAFTEKMPDKSRISLQSGNNVPFLEEAAEETLAKKFPPRLANFYFFDAADLLVQYDQVEMGKSNKAASLLGEVESALGFNGMDTMVQDIQRLLEDANHELEKEAKNNKKAKSLDDEIAALKKKIDTKSFDIEKLEAELAEARQTQAYVEAQMEGNEKNRDLQQERKNLREKITSQNALAEEHAGQIVLGLEELWTAPMSGKLRSLQEHVEAEKASYEAHVASKRELEMRIENIESQLLSKNCNSCGNPLSEDELAKNQKELKNAKKELTDLEAEQSNSQGEKFADFSSTLKELWSENQQTRHKDLLSLENNRSLAKAEAATAKQDLNSIEVKLEAVDDIDYIALNQKFKALALANADGDVELKALKKQLQELENDLSSKRNQLAKLNPKAQLAAKKAKNIESLLTSLHAVQKELKAEVREQIETKANEVLEELKTPLDGEFRLHVDDNYDLDTDRPQPNAGFKQTLFLSFLFAIPLVAKAPFPLVMDSPLQHIDADHYEKFVQYCKTGVEQLVLLPHDKEIKVEEVKEVFGDQLSNLYVITHNPSEATSLIEKRG